MPLATWGKKIKKHPGSYGGVLENCGSNKHIRTGWMVDGTLFELFFGSHGLLDSSLNQGCQTWKFLLADSEATRQSLVGQQRLYCQGSPS